MPNGEVDRSKLVSGERSSQDYRDLGVRELVEALKQKLQGLPQHEEYARQLDAMVAGLEAVQRTATETADPHPSLHRPSGVRTESVEASAPNQSITIDGELWETKPVQAGHVASESWQKFYDIRDSIRLNLIRILRYTNRPGLKLSNMTDGLSKIVKGENEFQPKLALLNKSVLIVGDGETNRVIAIVLPNHSLEEMGSTAEWFAQRDGSGKGIEGNDKTSYETAGNRSTNEAATVEFNRDESGNVVWKVIYRGELVAKKKE